VINDQENVTMPAFKKKHLSIALGVAFVAALSAIAISTSKKSSEPTTEEVYDSSTETETTPKAKDAPSIQLTPSVTEPTEPETRYERREERALTFSVEEGKETHLSLFDDVDFYITFTQVSRIKEGQTLAQGHLSGHELATVTLTQLNDRYLMSIQDMENDLIYRITGNEFTGKALIIEVDLKKMPAQIHEH
jgi:hypothetical protein